MSDDILNDPSIDWSSTTFDGARLSNHREFQSYSFARKLEIIEGLADFGRLVAEQRRRAGQPYFDPYTRELVRPPKT